MLRKRLLRPERLRRPVRPFAWIDPRLVHQGHLERLCPEAIALYLVLVTVADAQGLSYYGTARLCRLLSLAPPALARARSALVGAGLVAFEAPLYQVLALDPPPPPRRAGLQTIHAPLTRLHQHLKDRAA